MSSENTRSLLGKRGRENTNNTLSTEHSVVPPNTKRQRINRPLPVNSAFENTNELVQSEIPPPAPIKGNRPKNTVRPSALKGTNPKNRTRRISYTTAAPRLNTYELNNNAAPMVHLNSQTNRYFERTILPCLQGKLSEYEISEIFDMYRALRTDERAKPSNSPIITKQGANISHIQGIISEQLKNIGTNNMNINKRQVRGVPPEFNSLPNAEKMKLFDSVGRAIATSYEGKESSVDVARKILYALNLFRRYLPKEYIEHIDSYLTSIITPPSGGKRDTRRNRKHRSTRKN